MIKEMFLVHKSSINQKVSMPFTKQQKYTESKHMNIIHYKLVLYSLNKYKHKLRHGIIDKHNCDINKWVLTNDLKVLREAAWRIQILF